MELSIQVNPQERAVRLREVHALAAGDVYNPVTLSGVEGAQTAALQLKLFKDSTATEMLAQCSSFVEVSGHRSMRRGVLTLATQAMKTWYESLANDATATDTNGMPSALVNAWLVIADSTKVWAACSVPLILRAMDTNVIQGVDGVSPTVSVTKSGNVTTISITDVNGTHTQTVNDGQDGQDGESPTMLVDKNPSTGNTRITVVNVDGSTSSEDVEVESVVTSVCEGINLKPNATARDMLTCLQSVLLRLGGTVASILVSVMCLADPPAGMAPFGDLGMDVNVVTNADQAANVTGRLAGKQDALPYPTNAIPADVVSGLPEPDFTTNNVALTNTIALTSPRPDMSGIVHGDNRQADQVQFSDGNGIRLRAADADGGKLCVRFADPDGSGFRIYSDSTGTTLGSPWFALTSFGITHPSGLASPEYVLTEWYDFNRAHTILDTMPSYAAPGQSGRQNYIYPISAGAFLDYFWGLSDLPSATATKLRRQGVVHSASNLVDSAGVAHTTASIVSDAADAATNEVPAYTYSAWTSDWPADDEVQLTDPVWSNGYWTCKAVSETPNHQEWGPYVARGSWFATNFTVAPLGYATVFTRVAVPNGMTRSANGYAKLWDIPPSVSLAPATGYVDQVSGALSERIAGVEAQVGAKPDMWQDVNVGTSPAAGTSGDVWVCDLDGTVLRLAGAPYSYGGVTYTEWEGTNFGASALWRGGDMMSPGLVTQVLYTVRETVASGSPPVYDVGVVDYTTGEFTYVPIVYDGQPDGLYPTWTRTATNGVLTAYSDIPPRRYAAPIHLTRYGSAELTKVPLVRRNELDDALAAGVTKATVTNVVRSVVSVTSLYVWDTQDSCLYRREMEGGFLYWTPVTNVNALLPENAHILEYLETHRND